jgi:hypothetical protein
MVSKVFFYKIKLLQFQIGLKELKYMTEPLDNIYTRTHFKIGLKILHQAKGVQIPRDMEILKDAGVLAIFKLYHKLWFKPGRSVVKTFY